MSDKSASSRFASYPAWLMLLAMVLVACSDRSPSRFQVSGTVTYAGRPVEYGSIMFVPEVAVGEIAPTGMARIENGKFTTAQEDSPTRGSYQVRVMGYDKSRMKAPTYPGEPVDTPMLFPQYTTTVEIPPADGKLDITVPMAPAKSR